MNSNPSKRSSLFLIELMIAILFFCLCSAVCIRFFVKSHTISRDTNDLNMAVHQTSMFTELFLKEDDFFSYLGEQYPKGVLSADQKTFSLYYDKDWTPCAESDGYFTLVILVEPDSSDAALLCGDFCIFQVDNSKEIYEIETKKYIGRGE